MDRRKALSDRSAETVAEDRAPRKERWQERDQKKREELREKAEKRRKSDKGGGVCVCLIRLYRSPKGQPVLMD